MKKSIITINLSIILFLALIYCVIAVDVIPSGNFNGVGLRKIYNFTNISADKFCDDTMTCYTVAQLALTSTITNKDMWIDSGNYISPNSTYAIWVNATQFKADGGTLINKTTVNATNVRATNFCNRTTCKTLSQLAVDTDTTYSGDEKNITLSSTTFKLMRVNLATLDNSISAFITASVNNLANYFTKTQSTTHLLNNITASNTKTDSKINANVTVVHITTNSKINGNISAVNTLTNSKINGNKTLINSLTDSKINNNITRVRTWISGNISAVNILTNSKINNNVTALQNSINTNNQTVTAGLDAQDSCAEISGCVVGAITDGNTGWDNSYGLQYESSAFKNSNFTIRYELRTDRYSDSNISGLENAFTGWDKSSNDDYQKTNFTVQYNERTDRYSDSNISGSESAFNNWDKSIADEFNYANFSAKRLLKDLYNGTQVNSSITAKINTNNVSVQATLNLKQSSASAYKNDNFTSQYNGITTRFGNSNFSTQYYAITNRYGNSNFTAQLQAAIPQCSAGQYITSSDGNTMSCDTPTGGGGGGGDKWLDSGTFISPNTTFAKNVNATLFQSDKGSFMNKTVINTTNVIATNYCNSTTCKTLGQLISDKTNTSAEMIKAVNQSLYYQIKVNCDNILFDTGFGSAGICDGDDAAGAGSYDLNLTDSSANKISITDSETLNITGDKNGNITTYMNGNVLQILFHVDKIVPYLRIFLQSQSSAYKNANFTAQYNARTDRFSNNNFTSRYNAVTTRFGNTNWTALYNARTDRYSDANISGTETAFNNWDKSNLDEFSSANFTTKYNARTDRYGNSNFTVQYNAITTRFGNANFSTQYYAITTRFGNINFTSRYDTRTDRFGNSNMTARLANFPVNTTKNFNVNLQVNVTASTGAISMAGTLAMKNKNVTTVQCITFTSGGKICSG